MERRGVKNCAYRTLRYVGHRDVVRFLIRECGLDDEALVGIFKTTCPPLPDLVVMRVQVDDIIVERIVWESKLFSAMQKCTAFPIAAVADLILEDSFAYASTIRGNSLKYRHIPYGPFDARVERLFTAATSRFEERVSPS
jgi:hypothetical protein